MSKVSIVIASAGRPSLEATVASVAAQRLPKEVTAELVVVDDGPPGQVAAIVERVACPFPTTIVGCGRSNIAAARNAGLAAASGDFVAFIDDDEIAEPDWLAGLVSCADRFDAQVVFGAVRAHYPEQTPSWWMETGVFQKIPGEDGDSVAMGSTANALVSASVFRRFSFDEAYGVSGGEDTDFFFRVKQSGAKFVAARSALVSESVPSSRLTWRHLSRRYTRGGYTLAKIQATVQTAVQRGVKTVTAAVACPAYFAAAGAARCLGRRGTAVRLALLGCGNWGKIAYALGLPAPNPYR